MLTAQHPVTASFNPDEVGCVVISESVEQAHRVAPPAHTGDTDIGQPPCHLQDLSACLCANDALEIPYHHGVGMRSQRTPQQIEGGLHVRHPIAQGFIDGIFERFRTTFYGDYVCPQQLHPKHIRFLTGNVHTPHVHMTL